MTIQKVCHLYNGIFHQLNFVTLCQFYSITSSMLFPKFYEAIEWEKRRLFAYMAASTYHVISKEV